MNKLDIVKFLIEEIEYEQKLPLIIENDRKQAVATTIRKNENTNQAWKYRNYEGRQPSKARITNNCKKIRQLILDISKEGK